MWRRYHDAQGGLVQRRALHAACCHLPVRPHAGDCSCVFWVQENLARTEALPESLHPCGEWGDLLESPTEREEFGPSPVWPPLDLEALGVPEIAGVVVPAVRGRPEREESVIPVTPPSATPPVATPSGPVTRSKRARSDEAPLAAPSEGAAEPSGGAQPGPSVSLPSRPSAESATAEPSARLKRVQQLPRFLQRSTLKLELRKKLVKRGVVGVRFIVIKIIICCCRIVSG